MAIVQRLAEGGGNGDMEHEEEAAEEDEGAAEGAAVDNEVYSNGNAARRGAPAALRRRGSVHTPL